MTQKTKNPAGGRVSAIIEVDLNVANDSNFCPQFQGKAAKNQRKHHESADNYHGKFAHLDERHRVIVCKGGIQWILQRRDNETSARPRWRGLGYFPNAGRLDPLQPHLLQPDRTRRARYPVGAS